MTLASRQCGLCGRETTDWTISVEPDPDGGETQVLWCRDAEDCMVAHEAVESAELERT